MSASKAQRGHQPEAARQPATLPIPDQVDYLVARWRYEATATKAVRFDGSMTNSRTWNRLSSAIRQLLVCTAGHELDSEPDGSMLAFAEEHLYRVVREVVIEFGAIMNARMREGSDDWLEHYGEAFHDEVLTARLEQAMGAAR
ncbi:MAG: hypothetical protein KF809_14830 [Chloroflexi bacterium]|nr:hypothetical protein [Chloroflexota bacterium]